MKIRPLLLASASLLAILAAGPAAGVRAQTFVPQGPAPIYDTGSSGLAVVPNGSAAAGAVGPIAADPADPTRLWIGGVNGGIWTSADAGASWRPLTDHMPSLSIGALAVDPTSPVGSRVLVAGFGNFSNAAGIGGSLAGLIASENGGATWQPIGGTEFYGHQISGVAVRGGTILAAASDAQGGLWRSENGGEEFQRVAAVPGPVTSLMADPSDSQRFYAAMVPPGAGQSAALYMTDNAGETWSPLFSAANAGGIVGPATVALKIATGPDGAVAVGVVNATSDGAAAAGVFLYDSQGRKWVPLAMPAVAVSAGDPSKGTFGLNPGGQAIPNFALAIDPRNPNIVYVSGDRQELASGDEEEQDPQDGPVPPNGIGATRYTATVFRLTLNPDGSSTATALTDNFAAGGTAPHADTRFISFDASGNLLLSSDGGLYRRSDPQSSAGGWIGLNTGLQLLEAYKAAYDPVSGAILTAAQDNATAIQPKPGSTVWQPTQSGDGFNLGVDATSLPGRSLLYFGANSASIKRFVVDQAGQPLAWANLDFQAGGKELAQHEGLANQGDLPLASQFVLNRVAPTQIALGTNRVYVGTDPLDMTSGPDVPIALTEIYRPAESRAQVMALAYGTNDNPGALLALYAGSQQPVMVSLAATPTPGTMTAAAWPDAANIPLAGVFDPRAARRFYIVDGAAVYGTDDGGVSFRNLRGNLPASFGNIRATEFLSNNGVNALLIGGQDASWNPGSPVYVAQATNLTSWSAFGNGLPNAVVDGLSYSTQGDVLVVATLGRGVYALYDVTSFFPTATVLSFGAANNDSTPIASQLTDGVDANGVPFSRGLVKSGSGTLTIRVSSTYTGPTSVNAGIMRAAAANVLANSSAFTVNAGAMLDLAGYDQTIGSLAGAGFINLGQGVLTTGGNGSSTSFSGLIAGTGGLVKQGSGTFTLTGLNIYTGTTTVAAGTLALTADALVSGSVAVNSGATLGFGGAIGGALISAGTVTLPANGTRVSLGGSLMLLPGGTFSVPVTASGAAAGIQAGGAAQVAGALQLMPAQGASALSDNAVLVAAGGAGGQFAAVTGGLPGMRFGLDYQSDRITLVPLPHGFVDLAQNGNQRAVATALNAMPDMPGKWQISNVLAAMPIQQVPAALQNLTGAGYTAFEQNAVSATHAFQDMVAGRLTGWASGLPLDSASGAGAQTRVSSGRDPLGFGALLAAAGTVATDAVPVQSGTVAVRPWIASYGRFDHLSETSGAPGMRANGGAIVMGVDAPVGASRGIRAGLGAAFAYDFADISAEGLSGAYQQAYRGSLYGWAGIGAAWIGGSLDYAHVTEQATRSVGFGADTGSSRVTPSGNLVSGQVILARPVSVGGVQLMPQARLQTLNFTQNGFTEQGGTGAELSVSGRSRSDLRSVLGVSAAKSVTLPDAGAVLTPQLALGWAHEFLDPAARLSAIFLEGGPGFTVSGANPGRDSVLAGAALSARFGNATLQLSYDVSAAAHETIQAVTGGVRMIW